MIVVPAPLPNELVTGHLGRLYILNGVPTSQRTTGCLAELVGGKTAGAGYVEIVAGLVGQPRSAYVFQHTLAPFHMAVQVRTPIAWRGDDVSGSRLRISVRKDKFSQARLCPACVREDNAFWGYSYWRRNHQLPGIVWCEKHNAPLKTMPVDTPLRHLPEWVEADAPFLDEAIAHQAMHDPVIQRYGEICDELLSQERSLHIGDLVALLQGRMRALNMRPRANVRGQHLQDIARQRLDGPWLSAYFPDVYTDGSSSSLTRTYSSHAVAYATHYYALALALLFDSTDEVLVAIGASTHAAPAESQAFASCASPTDQAVDAFLAGTSIDVACERYRIEGAAFERQLRLRYQSALYAT